MNKKTGFFYGYIKTSVWTEFNPQNNSHPNKETPKDFQNHQCLRWERMLDSFFISFQFNE